MKKLKRLQKKTIKNMIVCVTFCFTTIIIKKILKKEYNHLCLASGLAGVKCYINSHVHKKQIVYFSHANKQKKKQNK